LNEVTLNHDLDEVLWKWSKNGKFSVKSVYEIITRGNGGPFYDRVWKAKIPDKIKVFMWLVEQ
jgi:hypothetical protein